jgi:hypothetical protein
LSRAGKGAQEGNKPGVGRVRGRASGDGVVGDAKSALVVRLVQAHVHPSAVLLVPRLVGIPGALLQEGVGDLVVNVLLLEHVLVRELHMAIDVLQPGRLAKADELVVDEAILDVVELVDVLHNCLTLILYKVLDKSISADGNTKANVAVNHKRRGREQGTEVREGGISSQVNNFTVFFHFFMGMSKSVFSICLG